MQVQDPLTGRLYCVTALSFTKTLAKSRYYFEGVGLIDCINVEINIRLAKEFIKKMKSHLKL